MKKKIKIAIVGGGFTGLSAAYKFSKTTHDITLFEQDKQLGGLAGSFYNKDFILEKFYHMWYQTDKIIFNFIKELKLSKNLKKIESRVGIYFNESIHKFSKPLDIIKFKPLPILSRLRFCFFILYCWYLARPKKLQNINCETWIKRIAGNNVYNIIWKPLLVGKFGKKYYKKVSAIWLWNKIVIRGKSRDAKNSSEYLYYYNKGFSNLVNDIKIKLIKNKVKILTSSKINKINKSKNRIILHSNRKKYSFDRILLTIHTPQIINLFKKIDPIYCKKLNKIKYLSNICIILISKKSLSDFYWINMNDENFPFVGIIEHTNFISKKNYNNKNLIYLSKYLCDSHVLYNQNNKYLYKFAITALKKKFPVFNENDIEGYYVWKAKYAQPITSINYPNIIPSFETPLKNVFVSTMSQVYPEDRGTNQAVNHGIKSAEKILKYI